jgi:hypothetical protein
MHISDQVQATENERQDALGLGDKLMKLGYEILEDEPYAPALARFNVQKYDEISQMYVRVGRELSELE